MIETLTFVMKLREMVSGGIAKAASVAQSSFGAIDKNLARTQKNMGLTGRSVDVLERKLSMLAVRRDISINTSDVARANRQMRVLETQIDRIRNKGVNAPGSGGGGMRLPGWLGAAAIGGVAAAGLFSMVKTGADQQRDIVGLSTFMGTKNANTFYGQVQQDARITPFVTHDLMHANRMLISTGMSADAARHDIMNLANAVAATGGSSYALERMALHLQTIRGMGHASYIQLREFMTNGINIMQLLSDATGKHVKLVHGMQVSYNDLSKALGHAAEKGGLFYGALYAQSQTIWGKWSTLVDDLQVSAGKIVASQSKGITGLLDLFDKYALRLPAMADQWSGAITSIMKAVISFVGTLISLAKWVYHNWNWLKYLIAGFYAFKLMVAAATAITALYNGIMTIAALRMGILAIATGEATAATLLLDAAMALTPWVAIAVGVAAVGYAISKLVSDSEGAGRKIQENLSPKAQHYKDITNIAANNSKIEAAQKSKADAERRERMNQMSDFGEHQMHWSFAKKDTVSGRFRMPTVPIMMQPGSNTLSPTAAQMMAQKKESVSGTSDLEEGSGKITGGGGRNITININHALLEVKEQVFNNVKEGVRDIDRMVDESLERLLHSANALR